MIVTFFKSYLSTRNNREYVDIHMLDNEDEYRVLSCNVQKDKIRGFDRLKKGSLVDLIWKPGFQGKATVDKIIVSDEVLDIIEIGGKEENS